VGIPQGNTIIAKNASDGNEHKKGCWQPETRLPTPTTLQEDSGIRLFEA
jgi:hypothetical protein